MRYAICFFGLFRSFEKIYHLILQNFKLNDNDILDIFISTSNFNNKKYRFEEINNEYFDINTLQYKIQSIVGDKLKILNIMDDKNNYYTRGHRILDVLNNVENYQIDNNFKYDKIILHRMDILFVTWETADNFYEDREEGFKRKNGLVYFEKFNFPIGVIEHGCCCIQNGPNFIDTTIDLAINLNQYEIICYEDYWIGHVGIDFLIFTPNITRLIINFYTNFINEEYLTIDRYEEKINSIQSYDALDKKWWLYNDTDIYTLESQLKLFLEQNKIVTKQLRFMQNISVLYIR
jgi:hypothetical protein